MAALDRSIFRQRAIDQYMQRREIHVILRLVSPRMFTFLWILLLLTIGAGGLVWSIQEPIMVQGKGIVAQPKAAAGKTAQGIVVLLLFSPDQQANLRVGQPVTINIATPTATITFNTSIRTVESGVMSPVAINTQLNLQQALAPGISGPSIVAIAPVEPMALAQTYLGSQVQAQVQIGSQSALSLLPGYGNALQFFNALPGFCKSLPGFFNTQWQNISHLF